MREYNFISCKEDRGYYCFNAVEKNGAYYLQKSLKPEYYFLKNEFIESERRIQRLFLPQVPEILYISSPDEEDICSVSRVVEGTPLINLGGEHCANLQESYLRLIEIIRFCGAVLAGGLNSFAVLPEDVSFGRGGDVIIRNIVPVEFDEQGKHHSFLEDLISYTMLGYGTDTINFRLNAVKGNVLEGIREHIEILRNKDFQGDKIQYTQEYLLKISPDVYKEVSSTVAIKEPDMEPFTQSREVYVPQHPAAVRKTGLFTNGRVALMIIILIACSVFYNEISEKSLMRDARKKDQKVKEKILNKKNSAAKAKPSASSVPVKPEMVLIKGGMFQMGAENSNNADEKPSHEVVLKDYFMGKYEVTVKEFSRFVQALDYITVIEKVGVTWGLRGGQIALYTGYSWKNPGFKQAEDHPVVCISWYDALEYCNWLSRMEGFQPYYRIDYSQRDENNQGGFDQKKWVVQLNEGADGYRLPTEAEWEYAARCGGKNLVWSGCSEKMEVPGFGNTADLSCDFDYADRSLNDGVKYTAKTGTYRANSCGVFDMTGNVWEMCWDWYDTGYYKVSPVNQPTGPASGEKRIIRGGGWDFGYDFATNTNRNSIAPIHGSCTVGFRLFRTAGVKDKVD